MDAIKFGKFLASLRNEKKLTQEELAEKLFIDKRKISRWECGMSIPDFETVIKLSEILDVTPYEFSICKRLEKEGVSKKAINKFKSIKDFKKYKLKKKILIILSILLGIFFLLTTIYTIKFYGKVEIYEFVSLDEQYTLGGTYINTNDYAQYSINNIVANKTNHSLLNNLSECEFGIYDGDFRILNFKYENNGTNNEHSKNPNLFYYGKIPMGKYIDKKLFFKIICSKGDNQHAEYSMIFKLIKKYDNKLF